MNLPHGKTRHQGAVAAFLLYANLPVGGIAVCFVLGTYALLGLPPSLPLLLLAFCAVFLVYQAERVWYPGPEDAFNHPDRLGWAARHRRYVRISTVLVWAIAPVKPSVSKQTAVSAPSALETVDMALLLKNRSG